jgi:hypothetical protein
VVLPFGIRVIKQKTKMKNAKETREEIISRIYFIRGRKVMLDSDLARIYGVETRKLNQAVKRNIDRFPVDFMFQLSQEENSNLMSQIVISSFKILDMTNSPDLMSQVATSSWGGRRKPPLVFTEHGALMLASVLNSKTAIEASIYVVRAFVKLREALSLHQELSEKINDLEQKTFEKLDEHSEQLAIVFEALRELVRQKDEPREPIGYKIVK